MVKLILRINALVGLSLTFKSKMLLENTFNSVPYSLAIWLKKMGYLEYFPGVLKMGNF